jgi:nucleotide-binding universal stress UspA family protein
MRRFKRILVASDLSPVSKGAHATAVLFAKATRSELMFLHVIEPVSPNVPTEFVQPVVFETMEAENRQRAERQIARLASAARRSGVRAKTMLLAGPPARQIIRVARTYDADLLVMGTHARRGLAKTMFGSVASYVLTRAPCPVVTVRRK